MAETFDLTAPSGPRQRLVAGAAHLLQTSSYGGVGVQALCDAADVRKGSFYHFFSSKEDLAVEALDQSWCMFRERVLEPCLDIPFEDRAEAIRRACLDQANAGPTCCLFIRLAASITGNEPALQRRLAEIFTEWAELLGGGEHGWAAVADIQGRMLLGMLVHESETILT